MHDFSPFGKDIKKHTEGNVMHHLTTRELLYLEDMSSLFESIAKNADYAAGGAVESPTQILLPVLE